MPRLSLNFAAEQRNLTTWNPVLGLTLLLAGMLALGLTTWDYRQKLKEEATLQAQRNILHQQTQQRVIPPIPVEMIAQVERANNIYSLVQTPWEDIFTALESSRKSVQNTIALISVKADTAKREISVTGEAKDFTALTAFTSALSDNSFFQNISLSNDKLSSGSPPVVVTFDLRMTWRNQASFH